MRVPAPGAAPSTRTAWRATLESGGIPSGRGSRRWPRRNLPQEKVSVSGRQRWRVRAGAVPDDVRGESAEITPCSTSRQWSGWAGRVWWSGPAVVPP